MLQLQSSRAIKLENNKGNYLYKVEIHWFSTICSFLQDTEHFGFRESSPWALNIFKTLKRKGILFTLLPYGSGVCLCQVWCGKKGNQKFSEKWLLKTAKSASNLPWPNKHRRVKYRFSDEPYRTASCLTQNWLWHEKNAFKNLKFISGLMLVGCTTS